MSEQIDVLANFIMAEIEGEPSRSEGAGDCAIRIIKNMKERIKELEGEVEAWAQGPGGYSSLPLGEDDG